MSNIIKLIVGLGNPDLPAGRHGKKYADTYHNVGFLFIEFFKKNPTLYTIPYTLYSILYFLPHEFTIRFNLHCCSSLLICSNIRIGSCILFVIAQKQGRTWKICFFAG